MPKLIKHIFNFYYNGFRSMTLGRSLWKIILLKLLILFGILKLFFFPNFLQTNFANDTQRAEYVLDNLCQSRDQLSPSELANLRNKGAKYFQPDQTNKNQLRRYGEAKNNRIGIAHPGPPPGAKGFVTTKISIN